MQQYNELGFIATLPKIISGKEQLNAIFSSYNSIGNFKTGQVQTGKLGLKITVSNGGRNSDMEAFLIAATAAISGSYTLMTASNQREQTKCVEAAGKVRRKFSDFSGNVLAVVYAGVNAPEASLEFVHDIKRRAPQAFVVVVTCTCGIADKKRLFEANASVIDALVVTTWCGGSSATGSILRNLISIWPDAKN